MLDLLIHGSELRESEQHDHLSVNPKPLFYLRRALHFAQKRFLDTSFFPGDCEIRSVAWDDLRKDYGCSGGEYAMEADAFARFQSLAQQHGVTYQAEAFNGDDSIMIVEINYRV